MSLPASIPRAKVAGLATLPVSKPYLSDATPPTHVLAIATTSSTTSDVILIPTHAIVLAASCSSLPPLETVPSTPTPGSAKSRLPLVTISLPAPSAFPALHAYLYTRSLPALLSTLLPGLDLPPSNISPVEVLQNGAMLHKLSGILAGEHRQTELMGIAMRIAGLCKNGISLGVCEPEFWDTLDLAWEVVLGALNIAAGMQ